MQNHKFEYVVSGVELSSEQKAAISSAIASAVSGVLLGTGAGAGHPGLAGKVWGVFGGRGPVNGGRMIVGPDDTAITQQLTQPAVRA